MIPAAAVAWSALDDFGRLADFSYLPIGKGVWTAWTAGRLLSLNQKGRQ
jgi:hypothetical protein